jgi:tetratricopeptide (TPR) repeat protein
MDTLVRSEQVDSAGPRKNEPASYPRRTGHRLIRKRLVLLLGAAGFLTCLLAAEYTYLGFIRSQREVGEELLEGPVNPDTAPRALSPLADQLRAQLNSLQQEAVELADFLLKEWPGSVSAIFVRGLILNKFVSRDLGVACWEECTRRAPEFPDSYYWLGVDRFKRGKYEEAAKQLRQSLLLGIRHIDARVVLAEALILLGRPQEALEVLQEQLTLFPNHPASHFYMAYALEKLGRLKDAELHYREVTRLQRDNYQAWHGLAMLAQRQGRQREAAEYFAICRKLQAAFHAGHQEARRRYDDHESLRTSLATAYTDVGKLFIEENRPDEAAKMWQRAIEVDPEHVESRLLLVDYFAIRRDWKNATAILEELCKLEPNNLRHRVNAGAAYMAAGNFPEAKRYFQSACELAGDQPDGYVGLVELAIHTGEDLPQAVALAEKLVSLDPDSEHYYLLARTRWAAGQVEQALTAAERAVQLDPGSPRYREFLARLTQAAQSPTATSGDTAPR